MTQLTNALGHDVFVDRVAKWKAINNGGIAREMWDCIAKESGIEPPPFPEVPKARPAVVAKPGFFDDLEKYY